MKHTKEQLEAMTPMELRDVCAGLLGWQKNGEEWSHPHAPAGGAPTDFAASESGIGVLERKVAGDADYLSRLPVEPTLRDRAIAWVLTMGAKA